MSMSPQALNNNEKLFPIFDSHLSDTKYGGNYAPSSEKFEGWLSNNKAYYTAARPWILKLLERAQATICEVGGLGPPHGKPFHVSQCPPELNYWVEPYVRLVRTAHSFEHMFLEPDLRVRLRALMDTVGPVITPVDSQQPALASHPGSTHPASPAPPRMPSAASNSRPQSVTSAIMKSPDLGQVSSSFVEKDLEQVAQQSHPPGQSATQSRMNSARTPVPPHPDLSLSAPLPMTAGGSASAPFKKKGKSKSFPSKGFLDADVEWFQQQHESKPDNRPSSSSAPPRSTTGTPIDEPLQPQPAAEAALPAPATREATMSHKVKSRKKGPPGVKASDFSLPLSTTSPSTPLPTSVKSKTGPPGMKVLPILVDAEVVHESSSVPSTWAPVEPKPALAVPAETPEPGEIAEDGLEDGIPDTPAVDVPHPSLATKVATPDTASHTAKNAGESETSAMASIEASDTDEPLATRRKHITFTLPEGLKRVRSRSPSVPLSNQRRKVTPTSAPSADPSSKAPSDYGPRAVSSTPREYSVASFDSGTHIYSPVQSNFEPAPAHQPQELNVSNAPLQKRSSKGSSRSKVTCSKISWQAVGIVVPTEEELARTPLFTDDSVVLGFARGQPSGIWKPMSFEFELDEGMFKALSLWTNRNDHERDLSNARCLSLACHKFSDCVDALKKSVEGMARKDLFTNRPVEWPPFPPSVCINDGQTRERRFAVSSWVTDPDHIVDISKRVHPGRNIVQLLRPLYPSPSVNYVFVLRFHPPTPRQSAEVMKRRGDSLAWGQFLDRCSHIDIPELDYEIPDL